MKILAVESSAGPASVCVSDNGRIVYEANANVGLNHSVTIMPMVSEAVKMSGIPLSDMDLIAVACGPGSFTGVRISVAAVKGIAFGSGKKCLGVSTLEAMAYNMLGRKCTVVCAMDARCAQVYCGIFESDGEAIRRMVEDRAMAIEELAEELKKIKEEIVLVGDGAKIVFDAVKGDIENICIAPPNLRFQKAFGVAACAEKMIINGASAIDGAELQVVYLRLPQAERELKLKKEREQNESSDRQ